MAFTTTPGFPIALINIAKQILPADGTNKVTVYTAGTNGAVIQALGVTSTDTVAKYVSLYMTISGVDYLLGSANIIQRAGDVTGVLPISFLASVSVGVNSYTIRDSDGNKIFKLQPGAILKAAAATAITAAKEIDIVGYGISY